MIHAVIYLPQMAATTSSASAVMKSYVDPLMISLCVLASAACAFFLINGAYHYMTSAGKPDKLAHAKKVIINALIGLVIILSAGTMTAILNSAYQSSTNTATQSMPSLQPVATPPDSDGLVDVLIKAITGLFQKLISTAAEPFLAALNYFTKGTPLMADNSSVFNIWLVTVAIADVLFVLVVALLGFHVMSSATLGLEELELKTLLPQIALAFLLINISIFMIDMVIDLSNAMIHALSVAFPVTTVWSSLTTVVQQSAGMGLAALLIMVAFLVFAVILLVYYVGRLVTLYLGAILSPLIILLWMLPSFKDFVWAAVKVYLTTIFVLFVHVIILLLAASIFTGMISGSPDKSLDPIMATVVGVATLVALLKTQGVMMQLSYVSIGPKAIRKLGSQFVNSVSYATSKMKSSTPKTPSPEEAA